MTTAQRRTWWIWIGLLALALTIRLASGIWWQSRLPAGTRFRFGDSETYWDLGKTIAQGKPYQYGDARIFRMPGYPVLLAGLFKLVGDGRDPLHEPHAMWGRVLSAILGTVTVAEVGWLAYLLFGERAALVAGAITTVYPEAIALGTFVLSEAPFCPLMLLQLIAWTHAWKSESGKNRLLWSITAGAAGGLATLMRPSWLLFIPFALVIGLVCYCGRIKQISILGAMTAVLVIAMLPWWVRNYQIAGRYVPTTLQVGASLYDGVSPTADGSSEMSFVPRFVREQRAADQAALAAGQQPTGLFEDRLDRRMQAAAITWARQNPERVFQLAGIKFLRMWSPLPNAAEFQSISLRLALAITYAPIILLALAGVWRFAGRNWPYLLCFLPALYFTCLHCVFVSSLRYRQPAMLPLIVLAAGVITTSLIPRLSERVSKAPPP